MTRRILGLLGSAAIVAGAGAATASADGLPVLGVDVGSKGVTVPGAAARYVTLWSGPKTTVVARVRRNGGRVDRSRLLEGTFTIPAVAYDSSASGLSADGKVLVLIQPRVSFPRARTSFAVLDARHLRVVKVLRLQGDFSFDAISPSGDRIYLIQYLSANDPTKYAVRAFDVRSRPPAARAGRRSARSRRADARPAALAGDEPRRALGLHALRRQRQDAVRPRARHEPRDRALHRPRRARGS